MNPLLLTDFYKVHHNKMYPDGMTLLYSNFTPRKSRMRGVNGVVFFGLQHFIKEYLIKSFNDEFFAKPIEEILSEYNEEIQVDLSHIEKLHKLGYLPIKIKALEEGTVCPIGVPCLTIVNTHPDFGWLVNYLETLLSCSLWQPITSATIAREYKMLLDKYALETTETTEGVEWLAHDFSMRGMGSVESAILSGMGHMTSFTGSDCIPAIYQLKKSYGATGLIGASVPATEHSVMCMGGKEGEIETFKALMDKYPSGLLSVVSDTWDLWKVCTEFLPALKKEIMERDGKLVIRPDSGDPVDILCGKFVFIPHEYESEEEEKETLKEINSPEGKGVIELLWDVFGGSVNDQGYKVLDMHIGAIYGDSITLDRAQQICERLKAKGFASTNVVFGVGSFTYQYNTRDTFGFAMKATYGEVAIECPIDKCEMDIEDSCLTGGCASEKIECREIFKNPITDDGTKKSAKGLLFVSDNLVLTDQSSWEVEQLGALKTVFENSLLMKETTLDKIRDKIKRA